jgi:hypothetical protein
MYVILWLTLSDVENYMAESQTRIRSKKSRIPPTWRGLLKENIRLAKDSIAQTLKPAAIARLESLTREFGFSLRYGDLQVINGNWYVNIPVY